MIRDSRLNVDSPDAFERGCDRCEYPDGACLREQRCRARFHLDAPRAQVFAVPLCTEIDEMLALPDEGVLSVSVSSVTVIMARPRMPQPRRVDRRTADQWIRLAGQEAISHAGICKPSGCICPNCREYQEVRRRALEFFDKGLCAELGDAWHAAMDEVTGGAANTPWSRPGTPVQPRVPSDLSTQAASRVTEVGRPKRMLVTNPATGDDWVADRFGGLDV